MTKCYNLDDNFLMKVYDYSKCSRKPTLLLQGAIVAIKRINRSSININKPMLMAIKRVSTFYISGSFRLNQN